MKRSESSNISDLDTRLIMYIDGPSLSLDKFIKAQEKLLIILHEVDQKISGSNEHFVSWTIPFVEAGSIYLTIEGTPALENVELSDISEVVDIVKSGIEIIEDRAEWPPYFTERALVSAKDLAELVGEDISLIQIRRKSHQVSLTKHLAANVDELIGGHYKSLGSIEGTLGSINVFLKKTFLVYDFLTKRSVRCYFPNQLFETAKDALGRRVSVSGVIRSRKNGDRVSIAVEELEVFPRSEELPDVFDIIGILAGED